MPQLPKLPGFQTLPFRVQVASVAAALALVGAGGYLGLVAPKNREITTLKAQLARQEPEPSPGREPIPPIGEEERKLWGQLESRLHGRFPAEKDLPGALKAVGELARSAHMELLALSLQGPALKSSRAPGGAGTIAVATPSGVTRAGAANPAAPGLSALRVPPPLAASPTVIKLTALHRYRDLVQFLEGLDRLPVAVAVESLEVRRVENRLSTEITLRPLQWGAS
jgi:hypothetical protein